ncbi:MAG: hypothetical protein ACI9V8_002158 [Urechidicola sp.]|jgi:hypothetical protein
MKQTEEINFVEISSQDLEETKKFFSQYLNGHLLIMGLIILPSRVLD